jgi:hypothetical protein
VQPPSRHLCHDAAGRRPSGREQPRHGPGYFRVVVHPDGDSGQKEGGRG